MSAEDLTSPDNYQGQLQQVECALIHDPQNEDLLKLRDSLQELIQLTSQCLEPSTSGLQNRSPREEGIKRKRSEDVFQWQCGDKCMAPWSEDGQFYEAVIEDTTENGQCAVKFVHYGNSDVAFLHELRSLHGCGSSGSKRQKALKEREQKKKRALRKAERKKEYEEYREKSKQSWQSFLSKTVNKKGSSKKSIFATPDTLNGRVGVGTCGIGGKPMTEYQQEYHRQKKRQPKLLPQQLQQ